MKSKYLTGNEIVDEIGQINISGNVIPMVWFQTIKHDNGKPNMNAIIILADIVYWYRPVEIRDEVTGQIIGTRKKFKEDLLQRSYQQIAEQFGITKKQVTTAINSLQELGVIKKSFRNLSIGGQKINNVLYIELVPQKLLEITYPDNKTIENIDINAKNSNDTDTALESDEVSPLKDIGTTFESDKVSTSKCIGYDIESDRCTTSKGIGYPTEVDTNTEITHKTTTRDYPINLSKENDEMDKIEKYTKIIKENIEYDQLIYDCSVTESQYIDEILNILVEVIAIDRQTVRISGTEYPYQLVKGKLLKLNNSHIKYVLECLEKNTTKIRNIKTYLLTVLYNAPNTIDSYYRAEVNHDIYGGMQELNAI